MLKAILKGSIRHNLFVASKIAHGPLGRSPDEAIGQQTDSNSNTTQKGVADFKNNHRLFYFVAQFE